MVVIPTNDSIFVLGGTGEHNCVQFKNKNAIHKASMPEKSFFSGVYLKGKIYVFGGYDNYEKIQLKTCEVFDIAKNTWKPLDCQLNTARSQSSACIFDDKTIYISGGFNKEAGTLATIEKFDLERQKITMVDVQMPTSLRRFSSIKISTSKVLFIGGIERLNRESDAVFCYDLDSDKIEKLDKIDRAGIVDYPIILDNVGNLHLMIENSAGTSPP